MKTIKLHHVFFLTILFLGLSFFAQAQTEDIEETSDSLPVAGQELREARAEERATKAAEREAGISEKRQQRIINLTANISNRLDAAIRRLNDITNRLESRITKLNQSGIDTSEAEASLAEAKLLLETSVTNMSTIDADIYAAITSETPGAAWREVRSLLLTVRRDLNSLQSLLGDTISALRRAIANPEPTTATDDGSSESEDTATTSPN